MSFELVIDKKKRAFTLSKGQYEYSSSVNDEIIEWLSIQLPQVAEIISYEYELGDIERCYDDLYNLFFLIVSDGSQLMELAISQRECEDRYALPKLKTIPGI